MRKTAELTAEMIVDDVMRRWPSTIRVFLDFRMRCVGCPIASFHSIDEACAEHGVDATALLPRILETVRAAA
jgi:hybrid cluster-associated redox disulfide protein